MIASELRHGGAELHLWLDAPKANILDAKMLASIDAALDAYAKQAVKVIVFEGRGAHFSFGASVAEHTRVEAPAMLRAFHGLFHKLARLSIPTAAIVRGNCLGGGLELAAWCTWLIAAPDAKLGQPEIKLAVFPPMASLILPWRIGGGAALDLCVSGRTISAADAHRLGLVTAIAEDPGAHWDGFAAQHLLEASAASLRFAERAARMQLNAQLSATLPALEKLYLDELMATHDANEGIGAFLEKRKPVFTHS